MNRIEERFAALKQQGRKGLVVYIGAGDPDLEVTRQLAVAFDKAGADQRQGDMRIEPGGREQGLTERLVAERRGRGMVQALALDPSDAAARAGDLWRVSDACGRFTGWRAGACAGSDLCAA